MPSLDNPILESQFHLWREMIKPNLNKALELTPEDKLDWAPAKGMISLGNIFQHISECSDWWYDEVINGKPCQDLVTSPDAKTLPKSEIIKHMEIHWQRMERFFAALPDIIGKSYEIKRKDKTHKFEGTWIYTHLFEHDLHHRSQINQYLRILGIVPPEI